MTRKTVAAKWEERLDREEAERANLARALFTDGAVDRAQTPTFAVPITGGASAGVTVRPEPCRCRRACGPRCLTWPTFIRRGESVYVLNYVPLDDDDLDDQDDPDEDDLYDEDGDPEWGEPA